MLDFWRFFRTLWNSAQRWVDDRCMSMAGAVAFYAAFSLAPTLVIAIAVGSFFFGAEAARGQIVAELGGLVGDQGAQAIQAMVESARLANGIGIKTLVSVVTLLIGSSVTFAELNDDINLIWRAPPPKATVLWSIVRVRLLSIGLAIGVGFLLVISLIVDTVLKAFQDMLWGPERQALLLAAVIARTVSFLLLGLVFALLIKAMLRVHADWRPVLVGGFVASGLFTFGRYFFGLYLATAGTADAFGAAGSLAVILMWLYYSAAVFLFGVVFARLWAEHDRKPS